MRMFRVGNLPCEDDISSDVNSVQFSPLLDPQPRRTETLEKEISEVIYV